MKLRVVLSERAEEQLEDAYLWWSENRSAEQAVRWYNSFLNKLETLGQNPERFSVAPETFRTAHEVRQLLFGLGRKISHRALFTIRSDMIYVFSVRHVSQQTEESDLP